MRNVNQVITEFFDAYERRDKDALYAACTHTWQNMHKPYKTWSLFEKTKLKKWELVNTVEIVPDIVTDATVRMVMFSDRGTMYSVTITARLVREISAYKAGEDGDWGVNPVSVIKNLY